MDNNRNTIQKCNPEPALTQIYLKLLHDSDAIYKKISKPSFKQKTTKKKAKEWFCEHCCLEDHFGLQNTAVFLQKLLYYKKCNVQIPQQIIIENNF